MTLSKRMWRAWGSNQMTINDVRYWIPEVEALEKEVEELRSQVNKPTLVVEEDDTIKPGDSAYGCCI